MFKPISISQIKKNEMLPEAEFNKSWDQEKSFKVVKSLYDPRFGDISVLKGPNNHVIFVKEHRASSKSEANEDIHFLKQRMNLNHRHLLKYIDYSVQTIKELCSTTYLIKSFYEFPRTDLYKEIQLRKRHSKIFSAYDLSHIAYHILSALHYLHTKDLVHGDVRPQLIGYDQLSHYFELMDRLNDASTLERCQTNNMINNKDLYLSPYLYKKLKGENKAQTYDPTKNDIFALGLVLVHLGTGKSVQNIFLPNGEIERRNLQEHVMNFDEEYNCLSPFLCALLKSMLQMRDEKRLDVRSLFNEMPTFEELLNADVNSRYTDLVFGNQPQINEPFKGKERIIQDIKEEPTFDAPQSSPVKEHSLQKAESEHQSVLNSALNKSMPLHTYSTFTVPPENFSNTYFYYGDHSQFMSSTIQNTLNNGEINFENKKNASKSPIKVVSKRRYIMKENGDVIEVDPAVKLDNDKIKQYFNDEKK